MAASAGRGPLALSCNFLIIDSGTLARTESPLPGPIGVYVQCASDLVGDWEDLEFDTDSDGEFAAYQHLTLFHSLRVWPKVRGAGKTRPTAKKKVRGITVNAKSEITGEKWLRILKRSQHLPEYIQESLSWSNEVLTLAVLRVPEKMKRREWVPDFYRAFVADEWEISTYELRVTAKKVGGSGQEMEARIDADLLEKNKNAGTIGLQTTTATDYTKFQLDFGNTLPKARKNARIKIGVSLTSPRGLILIATRVNLTLGGKRLPTFRLQDEELAKFLVHELACHAGLASQGLPNTHYNKTVNKHAWEIEDEFGKSETTSKISKKIEEFYK
jgi:hypothetical protein